MDYETYGIIVDLQKRVTELEEQLTEISEALLEAGKEEQEGYQLTEEEKKIFEAARNDPFPANEGEDEAK